MGKVIMKGIDLYFGIKAEQTLRDAVRAQSEAGLEDALELCPVGNKDWIAGDRFGTSASFKDVRPNAKGIMGRLVNLQSHQRIRQESIRIYAVRPPVPVFKDPSPDDLIEEAPESEKSSSGIKDNMPIICSNCGAEVHPYNIQYDPAGKIVGCYLCRGR